MVPRNNTLEISLNAQDYFSAKLPNTFYQQFNIDDRKMSAIHHFLKIFNPQHGHINSQIPQSLLEF
jgi:hypothetical protein